MERNQADAVGRRFALPLIGKTLAIQKNLLAFKVVSYIIPI